MAVAVKEIKMFCTKGNCLSTLGDVSKNERFLSSYKRGGGGGGGLVGVESHKFRSCCQKFDKLDDSKVIPV